MRRSVFLLLLLCSALRAAPLPAAGPVMEGEPDAAWAALFERLAAPRPIFSVFVEQRWFGFRKTPVVLEGEMRMDPGHGLSLHYMKPEERIVVMDVKGVLIREQRGTRELPSDPRAGGLERALLPALRFDLKEIRAGFVVHAARDGGDWRIDLEPRDAAVRRTLGNLVIAGSGMEVTRLEFQRSASQRVVIGIVTTQDPASFTPDVLQRFFR